MLAWLGRLVHRGRWVSLVLFVLLTAGAAFWGTGVFGKFKEGGFEDPDAPSTLVAELGNTYFGSTNPDVLVIYSSSSPDVDDPEFKRAVLTTLRKLPKDRVVEQISYWSFAKKDAEPFASRDGHRTFVTLKLAGGDHETKLANLNAIRDRLPAPGLETRVGGSVPLGEEFADQVVADIVRAELITAGPLLILLVILFGALTASVLPLLVAIFSIAGGLAVVHAVTYVTGVTSFALEVVTMMGVGLAIDYSLFVVSRFREELAHGMTAYGIPPAPPSGSDGGAGRTAYRRAMLPVRRDALARTMSTAGRTIIVSGVTVSAALGGLLLFPQLFLRTIGLAGIATVLVAVFGAIVLLPTLLALLGTKVEAGRMPWRRENGPTRLDGLWYRLGTSVMRRPLPYLAVTLVILGVLFVPFLDVRFGNVDARVLPKDSTSRAVVETMRNEFPNGSAEPIDVVVSGDLIPRNWFPSRDGDNIPPYLENYRERLSELPGVVDAKFTG
jgi:uncharacterized membrane protein YdfJ with MMPL/SSD domain